MNSAIRLALAALAAGASLLSSQESRADLVHQRGVFAVTASCPGGGKKDRSGTAFLVENWPDAGEVSLVSALHVVFGCQSLAVRTSSCDTVTPSSDLESLRQTSKLEVNVWIGRDLIVFRHLERDAGRAWIHDRPRFHWRPMQGDVLTSSGHDVVVAGATGKSVCFTNSGGIDERIALAAVSSKSGSLRTDLQTLVYRVGGPGASGGPVTVPGTTDVVAIHEAGLPDANASKAAIMTLDADDPRGGPSVPLSFPTWTGVKFDPPPRPHMISELDEDELFRSDSAVHLGAAAGLEFGGPMRFNDGARQRIDGYLDLDLSRQGDEHSTAIGLRLGAGLVRVAVTEIEKNPAGVEFDTADRAHFGTSLGASMYTRFHRYGRYHVELAAGPRVDFIWEGHGGQKNVFTPIPGATGEARLLVGLGKAFSVALGVRAGVEWAPTFAFTYSVFPVEMTRDPYAMRYVLGGTFGADWML